MKRKLLLGLVALGAASVLCGFDSAETADSVLEKMQAATPQDSMSMDMSLNVNVDMNIGDGTTTSTLQIAATADYNTQVILDPLAMQMDITANVSALGTSEDLAMKLYAVTNDENVLEAYIYTEDSSTGESGWEYTVADEDYDIEALLEAAESASESMDASNLADWGLTFELASEPADFDGTECYLLSTVVDADSLGTIMEKVAELSGEDLTSDEDLATVLALMDGLKLNIEYYVDTATYIPVALHMDMNDSDLSILSSLAQGYLGDEEGTTIDLVLNDVSVDATMSYGTVDSITVPDEAIAAAAAAAEEAETDAYNAA